MYIYIDRWWIGFSVKNGIKNAQLRPSGGGKLSFSDFGDKYPNSFTTLRSRQKTQRAKGQWQQTLIVSNMIKHNTGSRESDTSRMVAERRTQRRAINQNKEVEIYVKKRI